MSLYESPLMFKIFFSALTIGLLGFLIFFLYKTKWAKFLFVYDIVGFFTVKMYGYKKSKRTWKKIVKKMEKNKKQQSLVYNKLVIRADETMNFLLKHLVPMYQATDFSERLRRTGLNTFTYPKLLWEAHMYTKNYLKSKQVILTREQAQNMLNIYYYALKDLEVI